MSQQFYNDEALQDIHDEMYRQQDEQPQSKITTLSQQSKFFIGLFFAGMVLLIMTDKLTVKQGFIGLVAVGVILYFMLNFNTEKKELTWIECMIRVNDLLSFLQKHPIGNSYQIPKGEVKVKPIGRKQWWEGQSFKRSFGVDIYDKENDLTEQYFIEVDIFTGDIITFRAAPEGVYGDETKDVKLMPNKDDLLNRKRDQYMGNKR